MSQLLCWGIYFINELLGRVDTSGNSPADNLLPTSSSDNSYSGDSSESRLANFVETTHSCCCEEEEGVLDRIQCCVVDGDNREERCCAFDRAQPTSYDYLDCGYAGEEDEMDEQDLKRIRILRHYKFILRVSILLFGILGFFCLLWPETVVFNYAVTDQYRAQLGIPEHTVDLQEEQLKKEGIMHSFEKSIEKLGSVFSSGTLKQEDVQAAITQLKQIQESMIYTKPEAVSMTAPTRLVGGFMLFYACYCLFTSRNNNKLIERSSILIHLLWFVWSLVAECAAAVGHGNNLATSWLMITLVGTSVIGLFFYLFLERRLTRYHSKLTQKDKKKKKATIN